MTKVVHDVEQGISHKLRGTTKYGRLSWSSNPPYTGHKSPRTSYLPGLRVELLEPRNQDVLHAEGRIFAAGILCMLQQINQDALGRLWGGGGSLLVVELECSRYRSDLTLEQKGQTAQLLSGFL